MRRLAAVAFCLTLVVVILGANSAPARSTKRHTGITARAAILIDDSTGEVLWERNPDLPLPPASTTKIVTAMLALQTGRLEDSFLVTHEAAQAPPSKIHLRAGWRMRVRDLVYAVLLNSANDASVVIAEGISGSVRDFAERMNGLARVLGAVNTNFVNPNGLPADNHYSTARDLATMFGRAMKNPIFESIVSTKTAAVSPTSGSFKRITLRNHNRLLGNYRIQVVGKTGWTRAAKKCFVGSGTVGGRQLNVAVLGSTDLWGDLKRLFEFGFDGRTLPQEAAAQLLAAAPPDVARASGDDDSAIEGSATTERYFVGLGTFRHLPNATRLKNAVARRGYAVRVNRIRRGRQPLYRVVVGSFADRPDAERAARELKKQHRATPTIIVASK